MDKRKSIQEVVEWGKNLEVSYRRSESFKKAPAVALALTDRIRFLLSNLATKNSNEKLLSELSFAFNLRIRIVEIALET